MSNCGSCKAWVPNLNLGMGDCRHTAPRPKFKDGLSTEIVWPRTPEDSWCMKFERKEV